MSANQVIFVILIVALVGIHSYGWGWEDGWKKRGERNGN